jgi:hypothetical protein
MKITIYDEEPRKAHDLVCDFIYFLGPVCQGNIKEEEVQLTYKGKPSGKVK